MCICSLSGFWSRGLIFQVVMIVDLCSAVPIGMTSVFSMLNFAPDALHQLSRGLWVSSNLLCSLRNRVVFRIVHARGSIARSKRGHDRGSPCLTPRVTGKGSEDSVYCYFKLGVGILVE
ncbi:hypothetical protein BJV78DRAFT_1317694 [Lactifluus subvellereus]|nr:hypothetical protein BJV78DRAFT_1317694 [Lactifluus subvellereus]